MRDIIIILLFLVVLLWFFDAFGCDHAEFEGFDVDKDLNKEGIDNLLSVYTKNRIDVTNMNVTNDLDVVNKTKTKDLEYTGGITGVTSLKASGDITMKGGKTISSPGRMHITGKEKLYLLNKQGVIIGKEWGGNGSLWVQGNITSPTIDSINRSKMSKGHKIFNNRYFGGWDITNFPNTSSVQNCADRCRGHKALSVVRRKRDGHCWCKTLACSGSNSNDWDIALVDYGI